MSISTYLLSAQQGNVNFEILGGVSLPIGANTYKIDNIEAGVSFYRPSLERYTSYVLDISFLGWYNINKYLTIGMEVGISKIVDQKYTYNGKAEFMNVNVVPIILNTKIRLYKKELFELSLINGLGYNHRKLSFQIVEEKGGLNYQALAVITVNKGFLKGFNIKSGYNLNVDNVTFNINNLPVGWSPIKHSFNIYRNLWELKIGFLF